MAQATDVPAVELVPPVSNTRAAEDAQGMFYQQTVTVQVIDTPLWLASSPDGQGALCTDDRATLTLVSASAGESTPFWSHTFASADRQSIVCIPPQAIDVPIAPGVYQIQVVLEDLYPPTYGSQPYYLLGATSARSISQTTGSSPTAVLPLPTSVSSAANGSRVADASPAALRPSATPEVVTSQLEPDVQSVLLPGTSLALPVTMALPLLGGAVLLAATTVGLLAWRIQKRAAQDSSPPVLGMVALFDQDTYETRTLLLSGETPVVVIRRHPLDLVLAPSFDPADEIIAQIRATPQGPVLQERQAEAWSEAVEVRHDDTCWLAAGRVRLHYRDPLGGYLDE